MIGSEDEVLLRRWWTSGFHSGISW